MLRSKTIGGLFLCMYVSIASAEVTVADLIAKSHASEIPSAPIAPTKRAPVFAPKEIFMIPTLTSIASIGNKILVKFSTEEGTVIISAKEEKINSGWIFVGPGEGFSAIVKEISSGKTYRVTMKIPEDMEYGQKEKERATLPSEISMPPLPSFAR